MTEREWTECGEPWKMVAFARKFALERKARLFIVACCHKVWHLFEDKPFGEWVEVAERFADRLASPSDLALAQVQARRIPSTLLDTIQP